MLCKINARRPLLSRIPKENGVENFPVRGHCRNRMAHITGLVESQLALERTIHVGVEKHKRLLKIQIPWKDANLKWVCVTHGRPKCSCDLLEAFARRQGPQ